MVRPSGKWSLKSGSNPLVLSVVSSSPSVHRDIIATIARTSSWTTACKADQHSFHVPCRLPHGHWRYREWSRSAADENVPLRVKPPRAAPGTAGERARCTGALERRALGTGFCIGVASETVKDRAYSYIVTAHHVIDGQPSPELVFPDRHAPGRLYPAVPTEGPEWLHPIEQLDLAILPFDRPDGYWMNMLMADMHLLEHLPGEAMLAMPFHYVGLLEPLDRAMARSGTLGAVYERAIEHRDGYEYTCHLGDCRSYGGFSGSPCFIEISMPGLTPTEPPIPPPPEFGEVGRMQYLHLLCGMLTWHLEPAAERDEASILGIVSILTSDDVWRVLMADELVNERRQLDRIA
jgi:hypothetical protein